jgi:hypothetical protein
MVPASTMPLRRHFDQALAARGRRRRLSRLEFVLAIIIITTLMGIVLINANSLMGRVERTNVLRVEGQIRAALGISVATRAAQGRLARVASLTGGNPMDLLQVKPRNYLGALDDPDPARIPPGHWYFNTANGRLVYRVHHTRAFQSPLAGPPRVAFAIRLRWRDANHNGRYDTGESLYGVRFEAVTPFEWPAKGKPQQ